MTWTWGWPPLYIYYISYYRLLKPSDLGIVSHIATSLTAVTVCQCWHQWQRMHLPAPLELAKWHDVACPWPPGERRRRLAAKLQLQLRAGLLSE